MTRSANNQSGFSLVEVIAALAILSVAGLALMNSITQASRAGSFTRQDVLIQSAAETILNLQLIEIIQTRTLAEDQGTYTQAGLDYDWQLEITQTNNPSIYQIELHITDPQGHAHTLTTFRRGERCTRSPLRRRAGPGG